MSEREGRETRGLFRRRWTKVCGALEKTAADLGLSPSDTEDVANVLVMTPPKSARRRGTRSPSRSPYKDTTAKHQLSYNTAKDGELQQATHRDKSEVHQGASATGWEDQS